MIHLIRPEAAAVKGRAVQLFLAVLALTVLWLGLNAWLPWVQGSGVSNVAVRLSIHIAIALGLWLALENTGLAPRQRLATWLALIVPFTLWLAVIWSLAISRFFQPTPGVGRPVLPLAIFLPVIVAVPMLLRLKRIGQVLDAMPPAWLVALQVYRVFGGIFLLGWAAGRLPGLFALPAGIGDVTTGLLALPVAYYLASGAAGGRAAATAWNIFGLLDFAIAVGIGLITAPGPFQLIVPSVPSIGAGLYPTVMIPAFAVPSSILLHALSLRQLRRLAKQTKAHAHSNATPLSPATA